MFVKDVHQRQSIALPVNKLRVAGGACVDHRALLIKFKNVVHFILLHVATIHVLGPIRFLALRFLSLGEIV
jgi:hypothetical protein